MNPAVITRMLGQRTMPLASLYQLFAVPASLGPVRHHSSGSGQNNDGPPRALGEGEVRSSSMHTAGPLGSVLDEATQLLGSEVLQGAAREALDCASSMDTHRDPVVKQLVQEIFTTGAVLTRLHCNPGFRAGHDGFRIQALIDDMSQPSTIAAKPWRLQCAACLQVFVHLASVRPEQVRRVETKRELVEVVPQRFPQLYEAEKAKFKECKPMHAVLHKLAELLHLCREGKHQAYLSSMLVEDSKMGLRRRVGDKFQDSAIDLGFPTPVNRLNDISIRDLRRMMTRASTIRESGSDVEEVDLPRLEALKQLFKAGLQVPGASLSSVDLPVGTRLNLVRTVCGLSWPVFDV